MAVAVLWFFSNCGERTTANKEAAMSQYAEAGVDPSKIASFKELMREVGRKTRHLAPQRRNVEIISVRNSHGGIWQYAGVYSEQPIWNGTDEILGHLSLIAEAIYQKTGKSYHDRVARAAGLIIAVDVIAHGGMPFVWLDTVQASSSDWFRDPVRSQDYACGCLELCREIGCSLPAGESAATRYLVRPPEEIAPAGALFSGFMCGVIHPGSHVIAGDRRPGNRILGIPSTGVHTNGSSLLIAKALAMPQGFMTEIERGRTFGEEILTPMRSYVQFVEALLNAGVRINEILPGTGDGVAKLGVDKRPFDYHIERWVPESEIPLALRYIRDELGIPRAEYYGTFNAGIGLYLFVDSQHVGRIQGISRQFGFPAYNLGRVVAGSRKIHLEFEGGLVLEAPDE